MKKIVFIILCAIASSIHARTYRCLINGEYVNTPVICHYECNINGSKVYSERPCLKPGVKQDSQEYIAERDYRVKKNAVGIAERSKSTAEQLADMGISIDSIRREEALAKIAKEKQDLIKQQNSAVDRIINAQQESTAILHRDINSVRDAQLSTESEIRRGNNAAEIDRIWNR